MVKSQTEPDAVTDVYIADIDLKVYDGLLEETVSWCLSTRENFNQGYV
jgi:hypothetical protein